MRMLTELLTRATAWDPDAPAVRCEGESISYGELDRRSTALAGQLISAGTRPGDRVGLWLTKSIDAVVCLYAVLKCGAAYVPLDPTAPVRRITTILRDCSVVGLAGTRDRLALLGESALGAMGVQFTLVPGEPPLHLNGAGDPPRPSAVEESASESLAYVLYTSGSTGAPKGVMLSHRNALVFVEWAAEALGLSARDRLSGHAPLYFDLSIFDLFAAAVVGACVVLVPERHKASGAALNRLLHQEQITVWYSAPAALIRMLEPANRPLLASSPLRVVMFAGEVFPIKHLRTLRAALPDAGLWNLYGPTETNVCTYHRIRPDDVAETRTVPPPIGRACPYAAVHVVDRSGTILRPSPGVEGELYVSGSSVMRGYWHDSLRTAERIVDLVDAGGRPVSAYRTGDNVRYDESGDLVFVGRRDHMVKTRGYRVELGEIEAALLTVAGVTEAVCVAVPDEDIGARIHAYVVPAPGARLDVTALRRELTELLPRYMLPADTVVLDELPRTSTGKADRQLLLQSSLDSRLEAAPVAVLSRREAP